MEFRNAWLYIKVFVVVFSHHEQCLLKQEKKVEVKVNLIYPWEDSDVYKINIENLIRKIMRKRVSVKEGKRE